MIEPDMKMHVAGKQSNRCEQIMPMLIWFGLLHVVHFRRRTQGAVQSEMPGLAKCTSSANPPGLDAAPQLQATTRRSI